MEEGWPWATKLDLLLDIALREAVRRLESRLLDDECVPELRAAVLTQAGSMAKQLSEVVCGLTPLANGQSTPILR